MARERVHSIDSVAYQVFYDILRKAFIADCFKDNPEKAVNIDSPYLWNHKDSSGKPFSLKFFTGTSITDTQYFYRKYIDLDPSHTKSGTINTHLFVKGLEYIGVKPDIIGYELLNPSQKINHLYSTFLEKHSSEIKEVEIHLQNNDRDFIKNTEEIAERKPELNEALITVHMFYDNINAGNYKEAWNLLSPIKQNQKPWSGDFEKFKIGYKNTSNLNNIVVLHTNQPRLNIVEFKVFYDDEINAYTSPELHQFEILTVEDIENFASLVKKLQKEFKEKGLKGFEKIELRKLFDPDASEYIWYKANFPSDQLDEIFSIQKNVTVRRVQDCICVYVKGSWLINEIKGIKSYSIR